MIVFNTAEKLATKTLERLEGLNIAQLESSLRQCVVRNRNNVTSRNVTGFNDFNLLGTKDLNRMTNLLVQVIEKSKMQNIVRAKALIIKPRKEYKATLRLIKSYNNNIKY